MDLTLINPLGCYILRMKNMYIEIIQSFFRLGIIAFGGPAAHIALMETEFVETKKWVPRETYLDMIGFTNIIPGPNSTEMALLIGYHKAKGIGLVLAGVSFLLPAFVMVLILSAIYVTFGDIPALESMLAGISSVIIAVIVLALIRLAKKVAATWITFSILIGSSIIAYVTSFSEIAILLIAGGIMILFQQSKSKVVVIEPISLWVLFYTMLKIGSILYGGGYVLLAYMNADFIERLGWITSQQLIDAVTLGQLTPGPIFTTATFVGYLVGDWQGAVVATVGIFLPSFVISFVLYRYVAVLKKNQLLSAALKGINAASIGLMTSVSLLLFVNTVFNPLLEITLLGTVPLLLFLFSLWFIHTKKLPVPILILIGAVVGLLL
jgi:chromate transporter